MESFKRLNVAWRKGIDGEINNSDGGERPEIAAAFRESEANYLLECKIPQKPSSADLEEIGTSYTDFSMGWNAALDRLTKDQVAAISSWVRDHGEWTDYSDLEGSEYPAYIVKESDLVL